MNPVDREPGTGTLKLGEAIAALKQIGYDQWLIVDEESRTVDTPTACDISIKYLRDFGPWCDPAE